MGCSPWGREESDTTKLLHFHFSLSCIGEGNGNPLQCSCLENPRDSGAWWAAVYGVAQSQTRLKGLSRSSSSLAPNKKSPLSIARDLGTSPWLLMTSRDPVVMKPNGSLCDPPDPGQLQMSRASGSGQSENKWPTQFSQRGKLLSSITRGFHWIVL